MAELESALLQATKRSLADQKELGKLYKYEERIASLALSNVKWAEEALRKERNRLRAQVAESKEAESKAKEAAFEARRQHELMKSEIRSLRALIDNGLGWKGRRMENLEEAVRRTVNIVGSSAIGHHVKSQAAFDVLLQTLVDVSILNQKNIRGPAILPFCGPNGPDRFFNAGSHDLEAVPPPSCAYAGWGHWSVSPYRGPDEIQSAPSEAQQQAPPKDLQ
ncbi:hypothetical protein AXF42_Ash015057 [Apostasia shenzhenica]|uniref:Uncharacterized protein n=1 Tax=Apostasia shenzhenica TaxID=1088818 RepID=A0A2I0B305_9ASPA|nr:hypothetical protein AXF42_Ash015057 [Apostasia shenzhenica]